jgi:nicotinamidase-related amidase
VGEGRSSGRGLIERDDSILLVIDFQDPFLRKLDEDRAARLVDRGRFVIEVALGLGIPTFVTVEAPAANGATTGALRALLGPDPVEWDKRVFGLCGQPDLAEAITDQPRRTAVIIGLETDVCVLHSAVGLLANGFRPVIVSDATGAPGEEHQLGLDRARALGVERVHAKGLYYEWARSLEGCAGLRAKRAIAPPIGSAL